MLPEEVVAPLYIALLLLSHAESHCVITSAYSVRGGKASDGKREQRELDVGVE